MYTDARRHVGRGLKAEPVLQPRSIVKRTPSIVRRVKALSGRDNLKILYQWQSAAGDDVSVGGLGGWTATTVAAATGGYVPPPPDSYWRDTVIGPVGPSRADAGYVGRSEEVRPAGHGRVGPGMLEADAAKAAAQAAYEASPMAPRPNPNPYRFPDAPAAAPPPRDGGEMRSLQPQPGAANTSIEAGLGNWVEGYTMRRFEHGDADDVLPDVPRRLRIFGMEVGDKKYTGGWNSSYPAMHYDEEHRGKRVPRGTRPARAKKAEKIKRGAKGGIKTGQGRVSSWDAVAALGEKISEFSEYTRFGPTMRRTGRWFLPTAYGQTIFPEELPERDDRIAYPTTAELDSEFSRKVDRFGRRWAATAALSAFTGATGSSVFQTVDLAAREVGKSWADQTGSSLAASGKIGVPPVGSDWDLSLWFDG